MPRKQSIGKPAFLESGQSSHPLYYCWKGMLARCENPKNPRYADYGGRGITVCDRWHTFSNFIADMSPRPDAKTLDRIDNDAGYCPENCRWATRKEQQANTRRPIGLTVNGETRSLEEWSQITGVKIGTIGARLSRGWTPEDAIEPTWAFGKAGGSTRKGIVKRVPANPMMECKECGAEVTRKRKPSGRLESLADFRKRLFCSRECYWSWKAGKHKWKAAKD